MGISGGLTPFYGLKVDALVESFPAEKAGLRPGDRIVTLNEKEINGWNSFLQKGYDEPGAANGDRVVAGNERFTSTIEPQKTIEAHSAALA